eukprot:6659386-Prymnesium_polylepis.1
MWTSLGARASGGGRWRGARGASAAATCRARVHGWEIGERSQRRRRRLVQSGWAPLECPRDGAGCTTGGRATTEDGGAVCEGQCMGPCAKGRVRGRVQRAVSARLSERPCEASPTCKMEWTCPLSTVSRADCTSSTPPACAPPARPSSACGGRPETRRTSTAYASARRVPRSAMQRARRGSARGVARRSTRRGSVRAARCGARCGAAKCGVVKCGRHVRKWRRGGAAV